VKSPGFFFQKATIGNGRLHAMTCHVTLKNQNWERSKEEYRPPPFRFVLSGQPNLEVNCSALKE
jgi:hypothetical protein